MDGATAVWVILHKKKIECIEYMCIYMNIYLFLKKPILKIRSLYAKLGQLATDNLQILDAKMCRKF